MEDLHIEAKILLQTLQTDEQLVPSQKKAYETIAPFQYKKAVRAENQMVISYQIVSRLYFFSFKVIKRFC